MPTIKIDGTRTQTLRTILIAAFAALLVVLLATLGLQKIKRSGFHLDLPGRLGADISETANGYTYSQSQRGHTIFTVHASRIVEFKGEQAELKDVSITMYGPEGSRREDHISGSDFLYDKKSGVVTAKGLVDIDMASPTTAAAGGTSAGAPPDTIHVHTSDLRFDQKSGEAQTDQPLTFTLPRATGKSIGGDYNSKTGVLILQSAVELHADQNGSPSVVYAEHAQLLRDSHVAYLLRARSEYEGGHDSADQAIVHFRPDGSIQHLDAQDHVHMVTADGAELYSTTAAADFDEHSQPLGSRAGGGVNFVSESPESNMHGNAVSGTLVFAPGPDGKAVLHHAQFRNAVSFVLQDNSLNGDPRGSATREMTASQLDVDFAPGAGGKSEAQKAVAQGGAMVNLHDLPYGGAPKHTSIHGDQLVATLLNGHELKQLDGTGGTSVVDYAPDGATDTSNGDVLHVTFLPLSAAHERQTPRAAAPVKGESESAEVDTAVQQGHVTMISQPARGAKGSDGSPQQPLYADAATGTYHSADQILHLAGDGTTPPRVHNASLAITATTIDYKRDSGDAEARGDVRSTYLQTSAPVAGGAKPAAHAPGLGGSGPVHVVSATGEMSRSTNTALFRGTAGTPARMWQGANSVTAPVLELGKQQGSLDAHADASAKDGSRTPAVHAAFAGKPVTPDSGITRVSSDTLFYSDTTRTGDFHGTVTAVQPNGTVHSEDAQVFLAEAPAGQPSQLDRMIATGNVVLTQPGRRGTGQKLVYTAADGNYVLTGTPGDPPRAVDREKGTTTGAALVFRNGDNSVEVEANDAEGNSRRTVTDTRSPK